MHRPQTREDWARQDSTDLGCTPPPRYFIFWTSLVPSINHELKTAAFHIKWCYSSLKILRDRFVTRKRRLGWLWTLDPLSQPSELLTLQIFKSESVLVETYWDLCGLDCHFLFRRTNRGKKMQKEAILARTGLCVKLAHRAVDLVHFEQVGPELAPFHPTLSSLTKETL